MREVLAIGCGSDPVLSMYDNPTNVSLALSIWARWDWPTQGDPKILLTAWGRYTFLRHLNAGGGGGHERSLLNMVILYNFHT